MSSQTKVPPHNQAHKNSSPAFLPLSPLNKNGVDTHWNNLFLDAEVQNTKQNLEKKKLQKKELEKIIQNLREQLAQKNECLEQLAQKDKDYQESLAQKDKDCQELLAQKKECQELHKLLAQRDEWLAQSGEWLAVKQNTLTQLGIQLEQKDVWYCKKLQKQKKEH